MLLAGSSHVGQFTSLAGTPAAGQGGTFSLTLTANNTITPNATQTFTLTCIWELIFLLNSRPCANLIAIASKGSLSEM